MPGVNFSRLCSDCGRQEEVERRARQAQSSGAGEVGQRLSSVAPAQQADGGNDWSKFIDECFPPGPEPKGPFSED